MLKIMNTSMHVTTSIQRKIVVGTQSIILYKSIKVVCWSDFGCMTSPPICDVATTLLQLGSGYNKIHYYNNNKNMRMMVFNLNDNQY